VRQAGQPAQPDRRRIGLQLGGRAERAHQLVDRDFGTPPLDRDIVDRPDAKTLAGFLEDAVANAEAGAVFFVDAFEPRGDVHAVADHSIAHPLH